MTEFKDTPIYQLRYQLTRDDSAAFELLRREPAGRERLSALLDSWLDAYEIARESNAEHGEVKS